jgi:large subunit ribosomal protein L19
MLKASIKDKEVSVGDTIRVQTTVIEGAKSRIQTFEGLVISLRGRGDEKMMTVRRIGARQIGVERIWPLNSRIIVGVDIVKSAKKIRRAKLYYLRDLTGKAATQV